jgi:hypothetical protein
MPRCSPKKRLSDFDKSPSEDSIGELQLWEIIIRINKGNKTNLEICIGQMGEAINMIVPSF